MDSQTLMIIAVVLIAAGLIALAWVYSVRNRRERLRSRFGPEYDRTVKAVGKPDKADAILKQRVDRVERFKLRALTSAQAEQFGSEWRRIQARFVDDPGAATTEADALVARVMTARGYPPEDFETRAEDVSVDHPHVVENYRSARTLMARWVSGDAGTEELRQAIVNYRALFDDLLQVESNERRRAS